jgi:hypothetical protein
VHSIAGQLAALQARADAHGARVAILAKPRIENVAAQVLLIACGAEAFMSTTSDRFKATAASEEAEAMGVHVHAHVLALAAQADKVIMRRNEMLHYATLKELDDDVKECLFLASPQLRELMPWEFKVLDSYH